MAELSEAEKQKIIKALESKGAVRPCPRCGSNQFALVAGYFNHFIQSGLIGVSIGGPSVPTAVVACNNCGWLAEHALGALGLLPKETPAKEEK